MSNNDVVSEVRAVSYAVRCLAATLKESGHLDAERYVARMQSQIDNMDTYNGVTNKPIFTTTLNGFIDDIDRVKKSDS
ncbi:hypothetical protein [Vreelandella titanicae]|uniref:hypothetical protein n=1 Tax=Vreelandella titanicae TaxID=664683 RepID=UPI0024201728|nr:hypothetical protein [Halomonas titanicae]